MNKHFKALNNFVFKNNDRWFNCSTTYCCRKLFTDRSLPRRVSDTYSSTHTYTILVFHQEKIFTTCSHWYCANFYPMLDCIEDMATFIALAKKISANFFCDIKEARLDKIFIQQKFSHIWWTQVRGAEREREKESERFRHSAFV